MKNILSVDASKNSTGIIIVNDKDLKNSTIKIKKESEKEIFEKYESVFQNIVVKEKIEICFIEDYSYGNFGRSSSVTYLAEIIGIIKLVLLKNNVDIIKVPIQTWKFLYKNLNLPKKKNKIYTNIVNDFFKKNFNNPDECDAYMIMMAMFKINRGIIQTEAQQKLREKIREKKIFKRSYCGIY